MKKGFTFVELLAIIVILGILGTIGISIYTNIQQKTRNKLYEEQLATIESAVRTYITENEGRTLIIDGNNVKLDIYNYSENNNTIIIPMSTLLEEKVFDKLPINPNCGKEMNGWVLITLTNPGNYNVEYQMSNTEETFCKV